ncbi:MAG: toll/interleukin-1 receptor domain-containing protein [Prevotellaceae bacterium]|nr:toll/interleukin-1 receptor domain-containing protein [Candidatus Faecinaster equi]
MYRGFVIDKDTIANLPRAVFSLQESIYNSNTKDAIDDAKAAVKKEILGQNGIIDADKVMNVCMPLDEEFDIFISHSHADVEYANKLADYIFKKFGLKCFIDSNFWLNSVDDLQRPFDKKYKDPNSKLLYNDVLASTAHIHAMLSMSLLKMMNSCECCIFVRPEEEYIPTNSVYSPWIYEEITMFNYMEKIAPRPIAITESFSQKPKFVYRCDLSNMSELTLSNMRANLYSYEWLDYLYKNKH